MPKIILVNINNRRHHSHSFVSFFSLGIWRDNIVISPERKMNINNKHNVSSFFPTNFWNLLTGSWVNVQKFIDFLFQPKTPTHGVWCYKNRLNNFTLHVHIFQLSNRSYTSEMEKAHHRTLWLSFVSFM